MKCFSFETNLRDYCKFKEELGFWASRDMSDLLTRIQAYINYDKKRLAEKTLKNKQSGKSGDDKRLHDNGKTKNQCTRFTNYTKFKEACINAPQLLRESSRTDSTKYCCYHQSRGHDTEDFHLLRDAIEELIKKVKLDRFTEKGGKRRDGRQMVSPKKNHSSKRGKSPPRKARDTITGVRMNDDSNNEDEGKRD